MIKVSQNFQESSTSLKCQQPLANEEGCDPSPNRQSLRNNQKETSIRISEDTPREVVQSQKEDTLPKNFSLKLPRGFKESNSQKDIPQQKENPEPISEKNINAQNNNTLNRKQLPNLGARNSHADPNIQSDFNTHSQLGIVHQESEKPFLRVRPSMIQREEDKKQKIRKSVFYNQMLLTGMQLDSEKKKSLLVEGKRVSALNNLILSQRFHRN